MTSIELDALALSAVIAAVTVLLCFVPALWAASWSGRLGPRGRWVLDAVLLLPLALSPAVTGWAVVALLDRHGGLGGWLQANTSWQLRLVPEGLVLVNTVMTLPLMIRTMRPAFEAVDHTMVLTARTLGANRAWAWVSVTAAQAAPAMLAAVALGFAAAWGESGASMVLAAALQSPDLTESALSPTTVPLTLLSAMQTSRGQDIALRLSLCSVGVALVAMLISEWCRLRWRRQVLPESARGVAA
jgi:molybdate transport system permease protein